jgi:hypothetical protein
MSSFCGAHRVPRGSTDPIDSPRAALAVIDLAMRRPLADETIALVLDEDRRGNTIVVVDGTADPDALVEVVERMAASIAGTGLPGCLVVATVRPGGGPLPGDDQRWLEASDIADDLGVELIDWFVIAGDKPSVIANTSCPRDLLGEIPRWETW